MPLGRGQESVEILFRCSQIIARIEQTIEIIGRKLNADFWVRAQNGAQVTLVLARSCARRLDDFMSLSSSDFFAKRHAYRFRIDQPVRYIEVLAHALHIDLEVRRYRGQAMD